MMADIADHAQAREALFLAASLSRVDHIAHADNMVSETHCIYCGDPIPEARRAAIPGCTACLKCQEALDRC